MVGKNPELVSCFYNVLRPHQAVLFLLQTLSCPLPSPTDCMESHTLPLVSEYQ
ncbi:hypothetical protein LEMLEM_LOCUS9906 [Lemmus lemmus]